MNNIKNKLLVLFSLPVIIFTSCENNDYEEPQSFTDLFITMSSGANVIRDSQVDQYFSFSDVSAGVLVTKWTIPENTFFLDGPIPNNLPKHDSYIKEPISNISNDKTVHILFKKGNSDTKIKYYGEFADSTSYIYETFDFILNAPVRDTIQTINVNGKWIAEHEFSLDVYDTVVAKPEIRYLNGTILDYENVSNVTLNTGDKLVIEDLSNVLPNNNARPDNATFRVVTNEDDESDQVTIRSRTLQRDGDLSKRLIDTITFNTVGDFKLELIARRERTETLKASNDTFVVPTIFKVIQ